MTTAKYYIAYDKDFNAIAEGTVRELTELLDLSEVKIKKKIRYIRAESRIQFPAIVEKGSEYDDVERLKRMKTAKQYMYYALIAQSREIITKGTESEVGDYLGISKGCLLKYCRSQKPLLDIAERPIIIERQKEVMDHRTHAKQDTGERRTMAANFVEVFHFFKTINSEEARRQMRDNYSIINLSVNPAIELKGSFVDGIPYRINFYRSGEIICTECHYEKRTALMRMEYFKKFQAKTHMGTFFFKGKEFNAADLVTIERDRKGHTVMKERTGFMHIIDSTSEEHKELMDYIREEFIR